MNPIAYWVLVFLLNFFSVFDYNMSFGLLLTPQGDACRRARHALMLIATARRAAFITNMAKEVARYNTLQQNAQAIQINLNIILNRSKPDILRVIELFIEKTQSEIADLIVEVMDVVFHFVDQSEDCLKFFPFFVGSHKSANALRREESPLL
jgi:hypothetical protein